MLTGSTLVHSIYSGPVAIEAESKYAATPMQPLQPPLTLKPTASSIHPMPLLQPMHWGSMMQQRTKERCSQTQLAYLRTMGGSEKRAERPLTKQLHSRAVRKRTLTNSAGTDGSRTTCPVYRDGSLRRIEQTTQSAASDI